MQYLHIGTLVAVVVVASTSHVAAAEPSKYMLQSDLKAGQTAAVTVDLELGGEKLIQDQSELKRLPLSVDCRLSFDQKIVAWSADTEKPARCLRHYSAASATIRGEDQGTQRSLTPEKSMVIAEIRDGQGTITNLESPLTREQFDLLNIPGNSLAIDHLLPGRELIEGENWQHKPDHIAALLGMDHVAVCEVNSVVTGCVHRQVQIRMAGTVHGTIDGAATEIELRGAYLFHQKHERITKFNLAIKEKRAASDVARGLEVVAKLRLTVTPSNKINSFDDILTDQIRDVSVPLKRELLHDASEDGFRFMHNMAWYITAEQSDLVSLRYLQDGNLAAHCNVTNLPPRSAGRQTSLEQFELDVRKSLGENLENVTASTQWTTPVGHSCLGIVANGTVEGVPVQWRYYLIAADDLPRVSMVVTVERSRLEQFDDADRSLIDSLQLIPQATVATAASDSPKTSR